MRMTMQNTSMQHHEPSVALVARQDQRLTGRALLFYVAMFTLILLTMVGFTGIAKAAPVAVVNAGFEDPALNIVPGPCGSANSRCFNSTLVGWALSGTGGTINPWYFISGGASGNGTLGQGDDNTHWSAGSTASQQLGVVLQQGTYVLNVDVGSRSDVALRGYRVQLGVMLGSTFVTLAEDDSMLAPFNGFLISTVEFTAAAGDSNLGLPLVIRLIGKAGSGQVLFDDVQLDFVATAPTAHDVVAYLQAQSFDKDLPGGVTVPMWGFASCTDATFASCTLPTETNAPGPQIDAFQGFGLTIHLNNTLPTPVSLIIPGQAGGGNPVMVPDSRGRDRVQSFTDETAAGGTFAYNWTSIRAGTYLYQSGTQPSIQIPMGLYGALVVAEDAVGGAYPGVTPDADAVVLLSEIDPLQNQRTAAASANALATPQCVPLAVYVANDTVGYPCTIDYNPVYHLINGEAAPTAPIAAGNPGDNVLFRFLNAGQRTHTPSIVGGPDMGLIAEDGNPYPGLVKYQSHVLLSAGKTHDAMVAMPVTNVTFGLFDRMSASNGGTSGTNGSPDALPAGGMLIQLEVGTGSPDPEPATTYANNDQYDVIEDTPLVAASVLINDVGLSGATVSIVSYPSNGTLALNQLDGTFTYAPNLNYSGPDGFTYSADDGVNSYPAQVALNVSFVNDDPVAANDGPYANAIGTTIMVDAAAGVLGNDADPDGDVLKAVISGTAPNGLTLNEDGSFSYTGGVDGTSFTYTATDGIASSAPVTVTLNINAPSNIALTVQDPDGLALDNYRWLVQEDATFHSDPNAPDPLIDQASLNFHKSYMPIVAQGSGATDFLGVALDSSKHYYVSVLPSDGASGTGHSIGGAQILPGSSSVTVFVNKQPIPTAQISVIVFNDNFPTNGAPDANEPGLGSFQIVLEDAGGRYGISGGTMSQDAFGTPLKNWLPCAPAATAGIIVTCPDGTALIKDLPPGKYGVIASRPLGGPGWVQTSTIEGSKVIDAWVKANEPPFFLEFGGQMQHAFIGFVDPAATVPPVVGNHSISGQVTLLHDPRPPGALGTVESGSYDALGHTRAWVGLNDISGDGANIRTVHAESDGSFILDGIPDGSYQLVTWDDFLNQIIAFQLVVVNGADVVLPANFAVNAWFSRSEHNVFLDENENGIWDVDELPLSEQAVNLRWRDGTVNQSFPTDLEGFVPFDQTFPFFAWQVLEVDYTRFKATGLTVTVDGGGDVSTGPHIGLLQPQVQADGGLTRTETGPVLTQAFQGFPGQTSIFNWGKKPYEPGENGGVSGIVFYGSTRGENDPRLTVGDPWEPGIPGVKVRLYKELARATALNIPVTNAGFENPSLPVTPVNQSYNSTVAGWTIESGTAGTFNPTNFIPGGASEGFNTSYSNGSTISQTLGAVLQTGTYNLSVAVGDRSDTGFAGYRVQLGVTQGATFVLLAEDNNTLTPSSGFLTSTVSYTANVSDASLNMPLVIRLIGLGVQVNFDNVRLELLSDTALTLVAETTTDSWDDSQPTGCPGEDANSAFATQTLGPVNIDKCYDGFRNWNQARPGVFDGGYAFNDIPAGNYVVEVVTPPGYELIKEEDVNVGFGDAFDTVATSPPVGGPGVFTFPDAATVAAALAAEPGIAQPACVGKLREVPEILSLFPDAMEPAPFATALRPLCNRKQVILSDQGQAAADFHLFTTTPIAAQYTGLVLDDLSNETNPASPSFGEKWGAANVPVSLRDWTGREVYRTHGDAFGRFNGVLPSTFTANIPIPSGFSPAMMLACMNDSGDGLLPDPLRLANYGTACYTAQFMPGTTTYLDTPVLPQAAFAGGYNPVDCAAPTATPVIASVDSSSGFGPWLNSTLSGGTLTIRSAGMVDVPNPEFEGPLTTTPPTVTRDFGFGNVAGTVTVDGTVMPISVWSNQSITISVPDTFTGTGQLVVTHDNGNSSVNAVTVTRSDETPARVPGDYATIQAAIDNAANGDLILVDTGTYSEQVIMWKPLRLQGSGSETTINASKRPAETLQAWVDKISGLVDSGLVDLLPGQAVGLPTERGAGITVLAKRTGANRFNQHQSRIDGYTITGADSGGGIFVNGYATNLEIANNHIIGNSGFLHGGIRVGHPFLPDVGLLARNDGTIRLNSNLNIHHNAITLNGAIGEQSIGGGLVFATGSHNYTVQDNLVCGNYSRGDGAGIAHFGLSHSGLIRRNNILFNQSFNTGWTTSGGGVFIGGEPPVPPALTLGTGSVTVNNNLIQGNQAASGHGGGIRTQFVNGSDTDPATSPNTWRLIINKNRIVNNMAGYSGAGISLQDTVNATINNNRIVNNDSTATIGGLIIGGVSTAQPAGISAERHSLALLATLDAGDPVFSKPVSLNRNWILRNRAFNYDGTKLLPDLAPNFIGECAAGASYWNLGVLGEPSTNPTLTLDPTNARTNNFSNGYCNGARTLSTPGPILVTGAFGEGGNFLDVRYGPLTRAYPVGSPPWRY